MIDKSIRNKREELRKKSLSLSELVIDEKSDNSMGIRYKRDEIYKKWEFYDKLIKNIEKLN